MVAKENKRKIFAIILSPWAIMASILTGVGVGLFFPSIAERFSALGTIYLDLLRMCVLPIVITAVIASVGKLVAMDSAAGPLKRVLAIFFGGLVFASLLSVVLGLVIAPGSGLSEKAQTTLGSLFVAGETDLLSKAGEKPDLLSFVKMMIPTNPFAAASDGKNLPVVFFSILLGLSLGTIRTHSGRMALWVVDAFFEAFIKMITWVLYGLPIGLFCLFSGQVSKYGFDVFSALTKLIGVMYLASAIMLVGYFLLMLRYSKKSVKELLSALKEPFFVAFGTSSSFATIPVVLLALKEKLKLDKNLTNLVVPLGVTLNPQGTTMFFALGTLFIAQLYQVSLGFQGFLIVVFGAMLAGLAVTGIPGVIGLYMVAIVLDPLGLPSQTAAILLLAIIPFLDPVVTAVNTMANCACTSIVVSLESNRPEPPKEEVTYPPKLLRLQQEAIEKDRPKEYERPLEPNLSNKFVA